MIFQHTWRKVLGGEKTQTRRLVKDGEYLGKYLGKAWMETTVSLSNGKAKYQVMQTRVVQPSRNHPTLIYHPEHPCYGIDIIEPGDSHYQQAKSGEWNYRGQGYIQARIRITDIRREDVRNISYEDACAEGFKHKDGVADTIYGNFLNTWCKMHDKKAVWKFDPQQVDYWINTGKRRELVGFDTVKEIIASRPAERYDAWVLCFELVKDT